MISSWSNPVPASTLKPGPCDFLSSEVGIDAANDRKVTGRDDLCVAGLVTHLLLSMPYLHNRGFIGLWELLMAQLECNPLYLTTWRNDRNITTQKGEGSPGSWLESHNHLVVPWPPTHTAAPPQDRAGWERSLCAVKDPLEQGLGRQILLFLKSPVKGASCCFYGNMSN